MNKLLKSTLQTLVLSSFSMSVLAMSNNPQKEDEKIKTAVNEFVNKEETKIIEQFKNIQLKETVKELSQSEKEELKQLEQLREEILAYFTKDKGLKIETLPLAGNQVALDFLKENGKEVKQRLEEYKGLKFTYDRFWFAFEEKVFPDVIPQYKNSISMVEVGGFSCLECLKLNDVVNFYFKHKNFKNKPEHFERVFYPLAVRDDVRKTYILGDSVFTLSLLAVTDDNDKMIELVNKAMFDTVNGNISMLSSEKQREDWLKKQNIDVKKFNEHYTNKKIEGISKGIADIITDLKLKTFPMLVVNGKYALLRNAVQADNERHYNEDLSIALLDYVTMLALLESKGIIKVNFVKTENNKSK